MRRLAAIGAAALVAVAAAFGAPGGGGPVAGPRLTATSPSGSFVVSNSRRGMPVFAAANLAPGETTTGSVTIANRGTLGGHVSLAALDVSDAPGPNGGALSSRLHVAVHDVTARASPVAVWAGPLKAMTPRPLGRFHAGTARTYRFAATLLDGGQPSSSTGGDNAFSGSSTSVRFRWDAVETPSAEPPRVAPAGPRPQQPARDRRPPRLRLAIPKLQRVHSRGYLEVRARCDELCRVGVTGKVRMDGARSGSTRPVRGRRVAPGRLARIRVWIPPRSRGTVRRTLLRGHTVTVRLVTVARDRAGNRTVARRTVRLRPRWRFGL